MEVWVCASQSSHTTFLQIELTLVAATVFCASHGKIVVSQLV